MQFAIAAFLGALATVMGSLVGRVLLALGVGYVTYKGLNVATDALYTKMQDMLGAMPSEIVALLGWLWVDKALSTIASAYTAALAIKMAGGSSITRMVVKGKAS